MAGEGTMKTCPFCGGDLRNEARICYYCRRELNPIIKDKIIDSHKIILERAIFLFGFLTCIIGGWLIAYSLMMQTSLNPVDRLALAGYITLFLKAVYMVLVLRLSLILKKPWWLTVIYVACAPFSVLYLVPLIGLWIDANHRLKISRQITST
jgi:hypothetical protein